MNKLKFHAKPINIRLTGLSGNSGLTLDEDAITASIEVILLMRKEDAEKISRKAALTIAELHNIIQNRV